MPQALRSLLVLAFGGAVLVFAVNQVVQSPGYHVPRDFPEYWAAGRLNLRGENPYDPERLLREQRTIEPDRTEAVMMWNPPPALALYGPLGLLPARLAGLLWIGLQLLSVMLACDLLWRCHHPGGARWVAQLVGLSFVGTWWLIAYGQNTGLLLLGLAGFLYFTRRDRPLSAGACAALTALKPHLLAGFGVLLLIDVANRRGRWVILAGVGVILTALALALLPNSRVVGQFAAAVRDPGSGAIPLHAWTLPVPSYWLRMAVNPAWFWVQFVPCTVACAAILVYRFQHLGRWDWTSALPWVVGISVLTTPYGGWIFDLPVLLVPALWAASRLVAVQRFVRLGAFILGQMIVNVTSLATVGGLHEYWWVAPSSLALCLLAARARPRS